MLIKELKLKIKKIFNNHLYIQKNNNNFNNYI